LGSFGAKPLEGKKALEKQFFEPSIKEFFNYGLIAQ
jgi:hypothetical protein